MRNLQYLLGAAVRQYRTQRGLTQTQLADAIDRSTDMISRIERGDTAPSFETLGKLCEALQVSPAALFGGHEDPEATARDPLAALREVASDMSPAEIAWLADVVKLIRAAPR